MFALDTAPSLIARFKQIRELSKRICYHLEVEDYVIQPVEFVSPPKWHLAHTTWFFETIILQRFMKGYKIFHESYNFIFNSYYESLGPRVGREYRGTLSRPTVKEIMEYRSYVDKHISVLLTQEITDSDFSVLLELGLQHEQQHQELLIYDIKYILFSNPLKPAYFVHIPNPIEQHIKLEAVRFFEYEGGIYTIGFDRSGFAWDNESPAHKIYLKDFKIADRLVTNGEYLDFVLDEGYAKFHLWLADGWQWINQKQIKHPLYWQENDGKWKEFSLYGFKELNLSLPVCHISFYEANAYANWAGKRLLSEGEWEVAAITNSSSLSVGNFIESDLFHPRQANAKYDINQLFGDVWEWTSSSYHPYPGYKTYPGPLAEYNGKFMVNQMVLRGGSCATPRSHIRATYRNFFQPEHRWLFSGIRLGE